MPSEETPPNSPAYSDHEDDHFDENDVIEVIEDNAENIFISDFDEGDEVDSDAEEITGTVIESDGEGEDNAKLIFDDHQGEVLCGQFHPQTNNMVVTGGTDDVAFLWDSYDGKKMFCCKGHEDSIELVIFSYDGSYLATGDLNGVIKVWRIRDFELINTFELDDELSWMQWHNGINVLIASSQNGMIYMYKIPSGERKMVMAPFGQKCQTGKILPDDEGCFYIYATVLKRRHGNVRLSYRAQHLATSFKTAKKLLDSHPTEELLSKTLEVNICVLSGSTFEGKTLVCGFKDGSLKIVDLRQGKILKDVRPFDEIGGLTCLDVQKNNSLIICGCECGSVILINSNKGKIASVLQKCQNSDGSNYIEAVSFCKDPFYLVAASASLDGSLIIWDIVRQTLRHKYNFNSGITQLVWHPNLSVLFTCHIEGKAYGFDAKAGTLLKEYLGHKKSCLSISISSNGSLLMTTSEDKTVRIYSVGDL